MQPVPIPEYLLFLEDRFQSSADEAAARQMKQYMKGRSEFYGINSPQRRELYREHKQRFGLIPSDQKEAIVKWCWTAPQREWQYFAMEFLGKEVRKVDESGVGLYEFMIINRSWWDTVDFIAINLLGPYFSKYPDAIPILTDRWMTSGNIWLQRSCLLFQLKYKGRTDTELLERCIVQLAGSSEFFIRKAIGWALREYSKTDPAFVRAFVSTHSLSGLSHREALKWLVNKGLA